MPSTVSGSVNIEPKLSDGSATGLWGRGAIGPWAWLVLEGIATIGWLVAIGWAAVTLVRWLLG